MPGRDKAKRVTPAAAKLPGGKPSFSLISDDKLIQLYATMVKCRMLEERARSLLRDSKPAGECASAAAQEAVLAGVAMDLKPADTISAPHLKLISEFISIPKFIQGAPVRDVLRPEVLHKDVLREIRAHPNGKRKRRQSPARGGEAAQVSKAIGAAQASQTKKNGMIAVAFAGDGPSAAGHWLEALGLAAVKGLPILFVCRHNAARRRPAKGGAEAKAEDIAAKARKLGVPTFTVDGNDVVAVYRVAHEAIARARRGRGPTMIECMPYRLNDGAKTSAANRAAPRRLEPQTDEDPIVNMEQYLARKGLFTAGMKRKISSQFNKAIDAAMKWEGRSRRGRRSGLGAKIS